MDSNDGGSGGGGGGGCWWFIAKLICECIFHFVYLRFRSTSTSIVVSYFPENWNKLVAIVCVRGNEWSLTQQHQKGRRREKSKTLSTVWNVFVCVDVNGGGDGERCSRVHLVLYMSERMLLRSVTGKFSSFQRWIDYFTQIWEGNFSTHPWIIVGI